VIFNLAGQVSHIDSMRDPYTDLEINCRSQLSLLESCRHNNGSVRVVFAGSRQVYGRPQYLPVDEAHPVRGYFNDPRISGASKAFSQTEQAHSPFSSKTPRRSSSGRAR
jgi:nucleoside-diphosphate-sugar epimerase